MLSASTTKNKYQLLYSARNYLVTFNVLITI